MDDGRERERGDEFLALYNQLDAHLRETIGGDRGPGFMKLVRRAADRNAAVRAHLGRIHEYAELRNAIVHDDEMQKGILADPRREALEDFRSLVESITAPRKLLSVCSTDIVVHDPHEPLSRALSLMRSKGYAQVVVKTGDEYGILSVEGVARWLEHRAEQDAISMVDVTVGDATAHEPPSTVEFLDRDATVYDGYELFQTAERRRHARVFAILITETGSRTERPIGIATLWDLLQLPNNHS
jgi:CBS domain-containing protein